MQQRNYAFRTRQVVKSVQRCGGRCRQGTTTPFTTRGAAPPRRTGFKETELLQLSRGYEREKAFQRVRPIFLLENARARPFKA